MITTRRYLSVRAFQIRSRVHQFVQGMSGDVAVASGLRCAGTGRRRAASAARSRQPSPLHTSVFLRPAKKILPEYQYQDRRKCNMKTYTRKYESSDNVCIHIYSVLTCCHPQIEHDLIYCPLFGGVRTVHCQRGCLCPNTNTEHVVRQATWEKS